METYFKVTPVYVQYLCPKCKKGYLMLSDKNPIIGATPNLSSYKHTCSNLACRHQHNFRGMVYPQFRQVIEDLPIDPQPNYAMPQTVN
jgi:hypothetical protein